MLLTDAGRRLLATAQTVLADIEKAEEDLALFAANKKGLIRLSTHSPIRKQRAPPSCRA
jgi:DNA-binding transcriptional LysR family regulator